MSQSRTTETRSYLLLGYSKLLIQLSEDLHRELFSPMLIELISTCIKGETDLVDQISWIYQPVQLRSRQFRLRPRPTSTPASHLEAFKTLFLCYRQQAVQLANWNL